MTEDFATKLPVGQQIKQALVELTKTDGLRRTQRWLSSKIGIREDILCEKVRYNSFSQEELDLINSILNSNITN